MFKLLESYMIVPNVHFLKIEAPYVANSTQPGQFVILRVDEDGERIPLSISDWNKEEGTITVIFSVVGNTTEKLASLAAGMSIPTVVGPLGNPTEIENFGTVLCLGGCYGIGSIYPIARALKKKKNKVIIAIEAKSSYLLFLEDKLKEVSDMMIYITRDGTKGYRGHVDQLTEIIRSFKEPVNRIIINGCNLLLKAGSDASLPLDIKTMVCLNTIMIDGTGMCGVCRVTVGGNTKFACVDGPYFDGHQVNWDELLQRRQSYMREELISLRTSKGKEQAFIH